MIVDTSAIIAILRGEEDAGLYMEALASANEVRISAATLVETAVVVDSGRDPVLSGRLDDLLDAVAMAIEPFTDKHAGIARRAYQDFGKGSGHPAGLNLGDCFAYALARSSGQPLLFKGEDFTHTDVRSVLIH
ncbi:MAG: type II toxin-antitoxin system VapC family toxin [Actinomycetota bacterium]